jgi:hypothetical protein
MRDRDDEVGADHDDRNVLGRVIAGAMRRPVDSLATISAAVASLVIIVNALFLQPDAEPAPFVAMPAPSSAETTADRVAATARPADSRPIEAKTVETGSADAAPLLTAAPARSPQTVAVRHSDPIAELIGPSSRLAAAQRILAAYGYGQIKASGVLDGPTITAIENFERDHKMPVTGRLSDRLVNELAAMVGRPL